MRIVRPLARFAAVGVFALVGLCVAPSVHAASTLDQSAAPLSPPGFGSVWEAGSKGQSFTAGVTGALTSIDIYIGNSTPIQSVTVGIYSADGSGYPTGAVLASTVLPTSSISALDLTSASPNLVNVSFSPAPSVVAGSKYAFVISSSQPTAQPAYGVDVANGNVYAGGRGFGCDPMFTCTWGPLALDYDLAFATYVDPGTPVAGAALWTIDFVAEGGICTKSSATQYDTGWLQLPKASECTKSGYVLAGWVARQTDGPAAIEFAPGGWTFMTGNNHVHALWAPAK